jgi:hypothetical protein
MLGSLLAVARIPCLATLRAATFLAQGPDCEAKAGRLSSKSAASDWEGELLGMYAVECSEIA